MKKTFVIIPLIGFVLALIPARLHAGWVRTYGGNRDDIGYCVQQTSDGNYIVTGMTGEKDNPYLWIFKTNPLGDTLWSRIYEGGSGTWIEETTDGGYIIAGGYTRLGDFYDLIKTDELGDTLWTLTITNPLPEQSASIDAYSVQQTSDEGYIVTGVLRTMYPEVFYLWLLKTNSDGDSLWARYYGEGWGYEGHCIRQTTDSNYIVAGVKELYSGFAHGDIWLLKINQKGDTLWTRTYGREGLMDDAYSIQQTSDSGYIVVGCTQTSSDYSHDVDIWLLKTDSQGDTVWTRTYGKELSQWGRCVQQTSDGGYIVVGSLPSFVNKVDDLWLLKTDEYGDTMWTRTYGGDSLDVGHCVQQTSDGGYIITGYTESLGASEKDLWLLRTDSLGDTTTMGIVEDEKTTTIDVAVLSPIGSQIVLRYEYCPHGFTASIFDASGRKVDELHGAGSSGTITWGKCYGSGVYFIVAESDMASMQKVLLIR